MGRKIYLQVLLNGGKYGWVRSVNYNGSISVTKNKQYAKGYTTPWEAQQAIDRSIVYCQSKGYMLVIC